MRSVLILLIYVVLTGCSANRLLLVPTKEHLTRDSHEVVLIGRVSDSQIEPRYTFRENYLQPTPSIPSKGWKGSMTIDVICVQTGAFENKQIEFKNARISNDYGMSTLTGAGVFFPGDGLYIAFDRGDEGKIERALITQLEFLFHTVEAGDTLSGIAKRYYGDVHSWQFIYEANQQLLREPHGLQVGMTLSIPPHDDDNKSR